ncbi:MAG: hypothetical protein E4H01_11220 [Lysobacterales bacterium]|nr:MAG: hypothetical protein E4H01_11220 [Xanthomonadales bacterium]
MRLHRKLSRLILVPGWLWGAVTCAQAAPAGQLVIAQGTDAVTMDPHNTTQMTAMQPFNFLFNKLINRDDKMQLVPELAESWKPLDDLTWEVRLRQGVKFHNGETFDANAVKSTLDRVKVAGATHVSGGFTTIDEVTVVDPYTVRIVTKKSDPLLPSRLAQWGAQILPPAYFKEAGEEGIALKAIGTGPYRFGQWRKDDMLVLEANPDYWGKPPEFERVIFRPIPDEFARVSALIADEVDIVVNIPVDFTKQVDGSNSTYVAETLASATDVFIMGHDKPLQSKEVRLALNRHRPSETHRYAVPGFSPTDRPGCCTH